MRKERSLLLLVQLLAWHDSWGGAPNSNANANIYDVNANATINHHEHEQANIRNRNDSPRQFELWTPLEIRDTLNKWAADYPTLATGTTSQEAYGLPRAGTTSDCPFDDDTDGCMNYILYIQDSLAHPPSSASDKRLPEVLLSGSLHGNERVGPTAVMEAASLLLEAASCEAKPGFDIDKHANPHEWDLQLASAKHCRASLRSAGINDISRKWLARLVSTRRIVIVPSANSLGYFRNERTEGSIDPNRDFPYDLTDPTKCMQTIAGRTLNEIFREHMFQLSLTFHGGMEVVAYEWGAPTYLNHYSPDHNAQAELAGAYSNFGGGWKGTKPYDSGTMNDKVYYVRGGMEDWAYAGSWDPERVIQCQPTTFGGYTPTKTVYNQSMLRVFNMLVETSNIKEPPTSTLGTTLDVLESTTNGNGHVSRNIRLSLLAIDAVEPYVSILGVDDLALTDNVVPMEPRENKNCETRKTVMIPKNVNEVTVEWTVGGAFTIDDTAVFYGRWKDVDNLDCTSFTPAAIIQSSLEQGNPTSPTTGTGQFSSQGSNPPPTTSETVGRHTLGPVFSATLDVTNYIEGDKIVVIAQARVDQNWRNQPENIAPEIPPTSHIVNVRTLKDQEWVHESAGKRIESRLDWNSIPLTLVVGNFEDSVGDQAGGRKVGALELSNRFGDTMGSNHGGIRPTQDEAKALNIPKYVGAGLALALAILISVSWHKYKSNNASYKYNGDGIFKDKDGMRRKAYDRFDADDSFDDGENEEITIELGDM